MKKKRVGVSYDNTTKRWMMSFTYPNNGKRILKRFNTFKEACIARDMYESENITFDIINEPSVFINGFKKRYSITISGRVYSHIKHCFLSTKSKAGGRKKDRSDGYNVVCLSDGEIQKIQYVHRLVAEGFIENKDNKETINHIDGNKSNNHVDNLEWATYSENMIHAYKTGLNPWSLNNRVVA